MKTAVHEAKISLQEGNHGFGAVIVQDDKILSQAHDEEETLCDPTSHAEINAIRRAVKIIGKDLSKCIIVSTHEPCPMCSSAIVWSGIAEVVYGYPIEQSIKQGRKRINLSCKEVFDRAGKEVVLHSGILLHECELLYNKAVRDEVKRLRNISEEGLDILCKGSIDRRLAWYNEKKGTFGFLNDDSLQSAYRLLLCRFGIDEKEVPIVKRNNKKLVFHSMNFCPTLEACKILDLDTRNICKRYNEESTNMLIQQIDPRLRFKRNYNKIRPYTEYCEEMIVLE
jgi:tRNA(Arg) A34 adenosine deaminase TadA